MERYKNECEQLKELALKQLNLEKNKSKQRFEEIPINMICIMADEEQQELEDEIFEKVDFGMIKLKEKIDYERALEEIGDCAAVLVGLISKLNSMKEP